MDLEQLSERMGRFIASLAGTDGPLLKARLQGLISAFPFNEYEYSLMFLMNRQVITFEEYESLRDEYVSANRYLNLFELSPRVLARFGDTNTLLIWISFQTRKQGARFQLWGQYDLWLDGIRIEVKAARSINTKQRALGFQRPEIRFDRAILDELPAVKVRHL